MVIKLKIKKTGEIKELLELRRINRHGFIEKQYNQNQNKNIPCINTG